LVQIYIESWAAVLCGVFAISLFLIRKTEPKSTKMLMLLIINVAVNLWSDMLAIYFRGNVTEVGYYGVRITNYIAFATNALTPALAMLFVVEAIRDHKEQITVMWVSVTGAISTVSLLILTISLFGHFIYYFDEQNFYHRGEWFYLSQVGPGLVLLMLVICIFRYRKVLSKGEVAVMIGYIILPMCALLVQYWFYGLSLINMATTLSVTLMFVLRITSRSKTIREVRARIQRENAIKKLRPEDPEVSERMRKASLGKGNIKHIFIVNPLVVDPTQIEEIRAIIEKMPEHDYFIFTSRAKQSESDLVKQIQHYFVDYKLRIYVCGGSGTLRNVLSGIEDLSKVEVGFYPCGLTNDFLKCFGEDAEKFTHIENLIDGTTIAVDYIKSNYGIALNSFSVGLDTNVMKAVEHFRALKFLNSGAPYILSLFCAIFTSRIREYRVVLDGKEYIGKRSEVIFGNGSYIGGALQFAKKANIADGRGTYIITDNKKRFGLFRAVVALLRGDESELEKQALFGYAENVKISALDHNGMYVDFDGELEFGYEDFEAHIVRKGLHFIVPKGVEIHA